MAPKPIGRSYCSGQVKFAGQLARERVVVDAERVPQTVHVSPHHADPGVDLLPAIPARVAERKQAFGANLRVRRAGPRPR